MTCDKFVENWLESMRILRKKEFAWLNWLQERMSV